MAQSSYCMLTINERVRWRWYLETMAMSGKYRFYWWLFGCALLNLLYVLLFKWSKLFSASKAFPTSFVCCMLVDFVWFWFCFLRLVLFALVLLVLVLGFESLTEGKGCSVCLCLTWRIDEQFYSFSDLDWVLILVCL